MRLRGQRGKCLKFLVDERRIEANPDKIKAVMEMKSPRNVLEVQRLTDYLTTLGRFLSLSADKSSFFFKAVKRKEFTWDDEAKQTFASLKKYLSTLPKLISPLPRRAINKAQALADFITKCVHNPTPDR